MGTNLFAEIIVHTGHYPLGSLLLVWTILKDWIKVPYTHYLSLIYTQLKLLLKKISIYNLYLSARSANAWPQWPEAFDELQMYSNICWFHIHGRQTSAWITAQQNTASLQSSVWIETINYPILFFSFFILPSLVTLVFWWEIYLPHCYFSIIHIKVFNNILN